MLNKIHPSPSCFRNTCAPFILLTLASCGGQTGSSPGTEPGSTGSESNASSSSSSSTSSSSSSGSNIDVVGWCEELLDQQRQPLKESSGSGLTSIGARYPLSETQMSMPLNELVLSFDEPIVGNLPAQHNEDPHYIYSGTGSLLLNGSTFSAIYEGTVPHPLTLNFWVYPVGEGVVDFEVEWYSLIFHCGGTPNDYGATGGASEHKAQFSAEAHAWTNISIEINGSTDLHWNISAVPGVGDTVVPREFYLDELRLYTEE